MRLSLQPPGMLKWSYCTSRHCKHLPDAAASARKADRTQPLRSFLPAKQASTLLARPRISKPGHTTTWSGGYWRAPVQRADEVLLQAALHVHDQEVHDRLGHRVLQAGAHERKVALHQQPSHLHLHLLLLRRAHRHAQRLHAHAPGLNRRAPGVRAGWRARAQTPHGLRGGTSMHTCEGRMPALQACGVQASSWQACW